MTIVVSGDTDYTGQTFSNETGITFTTQATATFTASQFGPGLISNTVTITSNAAINNIVVNKTNSTAFTAAGWTFVNWDIGADTVTINGSSQAESITGSIQNDSISGGDGGDTLDGGAGADTLNGGDGDDTYILQASLDTIIDSSGTDTVVVLNSYTLAAGLENLTRVAGGASSFVTLTGNGAGNIITNSASTGCVIDGGAGADVMNGGTGSELFIVDDAGDVVNDLGGDFDAVNTTLASYTLATGIENLTGISATGQTLTGNNATNVITGGAANDTLNGGGGGDLLDGGGGDDSMLGGTGNDIYIVSTNGDLVVELADEGTDTVLLSLSSYTLGANVENGSQSSTVAATLTGNGLDNILDGNDGNDTLSGLGGNDTISGGGGDDSVLGGEGDDFLTGDGGTDTIYGEAGDDRISSSAGGDELRGGADNDAYTILNADAVVIELANQGVDTVFSRIHAISLGANVENLVQLATISAALTGNALGNSITGNNGNDTLNGGAGDDMLVGNAGNDVYVVDSTSDVIVENSFDAADEAQTTLTSFTLGTTAGSSGVERLVFIGTGAFSGFGNAQANLIAGGGGGNAIGGLGGDDTLIGGDGDDRLDGGEGADSLIGGTGFDYVSYNAATSGVLVDIGFSNGVGGDAQGDAFGGIEGVTASNFDDGVWSTGGGDALYLWWGDDYADARGGNDTVFGGGGNDTIAGGEGADLVFGEAGIDLLNGNDGDDVVRGGDDVDAGRRHRQRHRRRRQGQRLDVGRHRIGRLRVPSGGPRQRRRRPHHGFPGRGAEWNRLRQVLHRRHQPGRRLPLQPGHKLRDPDRARARARLPLHRDPQRHRRAGAGPVLLRVRARNRRGRGGQKQSLIDRLADNRRLWPPDFESLSLQDASHRSDSTRCGKRADGLQRRQKTAVHRRPRRGTLVIARRDEDAQPWLRRRIGSADGGAGSGRKPPPCLPSGPHRAPPFRRNAQASPGALPSRAPAAPEGALPEARGIAVSPSHPSSLGRPNRIKPAGNSA